MTTELGPKLRALREEHGWSLREVARRAGVAPGYLSTLERGGNARPAATMLRKLAEGYREPLSVIMRWAGVTLDGPSANQLLVLTYLGEDFTEEELRVVKAVLDVVRARDRLSSP